MEPEIISPTDGIKDCLTRLGHRVSHASKQWAIGRLSHEDIQELSEAVREAKELVKQEEKELVLLRDSVDRAIRLQQMVGGQDGV